MAKLRSRYLGRKNCSSLDYGSELFPRGLVFTSKGVYDIILKEIEKSFGARLQQITEKLLVDVAISNEVWNEKIILVARKNIYLDLAIKSIVSVDGVGTVVALIGFPVGGTNGVLLSYLQEILQRIGISDATFLGNSWEVSLTIDQYFVRADFCGTGFVNQDVFPVYVTKDEYAACFINTLLIAN